MKHNHNEIDKSLIMSSPKPTSIFFFVTLLSIGALAKPPEKIVGGTDASPGEFPHVVSLRRNGGHFCGGSIIDNQHILTAAHCVKDPMAAPYTDITVVSATTSLAQGGNVHMVKRATYHPSFQMDGEVSYPNDIAVVTLAAPMDFDSYQAAVSLPTKSSYVGSPARLAGWGFLYANSGAASVALQKLQTEVQDIATCEAQLPGKTLYNEQTCAIQAQGLGVCSGDSGSGLIVGQEVVGVASFVIPCAIGYPDVYTKVSSYLDFIKEEMAQT